MSFIDRYERTLIDGAKRVAERPPMPASNATAPADVAAAPTRPRRPARRRLWAGGLVAAAAATAAVLAIPAGSQLSPIEEARAALTPGPAIIHLKVRSLMDPPPGMPLPPCMPVDPTEMWQTTTAPMRRKIIGGRSPADADCPNGTMPDDTAVTASMQVIFASTAGEGSSGHDVFYSPDLKHAVKVTGAGESLRSLDLTAPDEGFSSPQASDPQATLRRFLTSPDIEYVGQSTTATGSDIRTFVLPEPTLEGDDPDRPKDGTLTYVVDAETYAPKRVELRQRVNVAQPDEPAHYQEVMTGFAFDAWERLPLDAEHEKLLEIDVPPDATVVTGTPKEIYQDLTRKERLARRKAGKARLDAYLAEQHAVGRNP